MSRVSLQADIIDRRIQNEAQVTFDNLTHRAKTDNRLSLQGQKIAELTDAVEMTRLAA